MHNNNDKPRAGTVEYSLWRFSKLANQSSLHPRDWKRFYEFIVVAHQRHVGWGADTVQNKLKAYGFDDRHAAELATAYWHGRCSLYLQKPRPITTEHCAWKKDKSIRWK